MRKSWVLVGGVTALLLTAGGTVAWATAGPTSSQPPATARSQVAAATALDTATQSSFTAVAPCRVADTRLGGGPLGSGQVRDFVLGGTAQFTPQGGASGGCGVPLTATSVALTVTVVTPTHSGYLKVWQTGASEPPASFMNYGTDFNASVASTVTISALGQARVKNVGSTAQLVIDVTGYFVAPMTAQVTTDGSLVKGSRVTGSSLVAGTVSSYEVDFDRDVSGCAYSVASYFNSFVVSAQPRVGVPNAVFVVTALNSTPTSDRFYLTVTC